MRLLATLSANQQEVVRLKFQAGLSYRQISEVTGLSVTNVGFLLHTAIARLRKRVADNEHEGCNLRPAEKPLGGQQKELGGNQSLLGGPDNLLSGRR